MSEQEYQNCPYCDEQIKYGALKCKYCQTMLTVGIEENNDYNTLPIEQTDKPHENSKPYLSEIAQEKGKRKSTGLIVVSILLLVLGVLGLFMSSIMFGDIGLAAMIGAFSAILSGIGFLIANKIMA